MAGSTEEEQIEVLKDWWNEHGTSTLVGIVLAVGGVLGYQAWQNNVRETGEVASLIYKDLVAANASIAEETADDTTDNVVPDAEDGAENKSAENPMMTTARSLAKTLKTDYTDSTYARFAALHLAKLAVDSGDLEAAVSELEWILEQGVGEELEVIVRMRLARVLMAQDNTDEALATLDVTLDNSAQRASFEEVRGDIYHATGDYQKARNAYQFALESLSDGADRPMLKTKLAAISVPTGVDSTQNTADKTGEDTLELNEQHAPSDSEDGT